ncbi:MAG TPA: hypothetical protein VK735_20190 [Pseudonocardia sp.]|uniref:hypothetical protein n=1 Tax=Pseudonocardia sp. TaxID=60912 RepID=UPI002B68909D|nr:hypothetical protein [Pseudonocardia sp.]HTF49768.1 hypothetical protein [Pseudonocardia sp.]
MSTQICLRFVIDGIRDTMDHYRDGALPLHRLSWELHSRINTLVPHAPAVWIDQLRDLHRRIAEVHARGETGALGELERRQLEDSLRRLRAALESAYRDQL